MLGCGLGLCWWRVSRAVIVLLLVSVLVGVAAVPAGAVKLRKPRVEQVSLMYVLNAGSGTLRPLAGRARVFTLTLRHLERRVVWFSARPARDSGTFASSRVAADWKGFGFKSSPPNAALVYPDARGDGSTVILTLTDPRYSKRTGTLSFTARWLDPAKVTEPNLRQHAKSADPTPNHTFSSPSLFIDDTTAPVINGCTIQPETLCPEANLAGADLHGADLQEADFVLANLSGANLSGADLSGANLHWAILTRADLEGVDLTQADSLTSLVQVFADGADFHGAHFAQTDFYGASLIGADFTNTNSDVNSGIHFALATLTNANFSGAVLPDAGFWGANLRGADFTNTNLIRARFEYANLHWATLTGANLTDAFYCYTTMPDGSTTDC